MKYYSEYLDSLFDTEEELNVAEEKIKAAMKEKEEEIDEKASNYD